ncbi:hypothetical protein CLU79DRAFT_704465, partial [Phycomyces nitens]
IGSEALHLYTPRPTEWPDGTKSDVLYAPSVVSADFPPMLIEIQRTIDQAFIDRLLNYSLNVKNEYEAKPVILVFGIERTCSYISTDFEETQHSFVKEISCKYWAKNCFFIDHDTIEKDLIQPSLHPLLAIGVFLCGQKPSLISMEHKNDTTMQKLYKIAKEQTEEENKETPIAAALADVCNQTSTQFQKIINVIGAMPDSLLKKRALAYADDGVLYTETCKRKYFKKSSPCVSPMPAPLELPEATIKQMNVNATGCENKDDILPESSIPKNDMDYALQFKKSVETMNWKECFETGKKDGYFSNYATPASLKRAFFKKRSNEE